MLFMMGRMRFLLGLDDLPDTGGGEGTYEGTYDENPKVAEGRATLEDGGSYTAGGVHTGAGVADADEVDEHEGETDGEAGEVVGGAVGLVGGTQHYEHEDAGEDNFSQQAAKDIDASLEVVGARAFKTLDIAYEEPKQGAADEGADDLEEHIHAGVLAAHAASGPAAEGDGGIDVATADTADGVGHAYYGETEGEGRADDTAGIHRDGAVGRTVEAYGHAAAHENEHHGAEHFCKILFHNNVF